MRARIAAGRSVASWNSAVERSLAGLESELAESFGECVRADRAPGLSAGEQPGRGAGVADGGVSATGRDDREDKRGDGFGQHDGLVAEPETDLPGAGVDVVDGEAADRGRPLGVEQDEQAGDAVFGFDGVVVQQPPGLVPSGLGVDDTAGTVPSDGGASRVVSFCFLAQRTKCRVSRRSVALSLAAIRRGCLAVRREREVVGGAANRAM